MYLTPQQCAFELEGSVQRKISFKLEGCARADSRDQSAAEAALKPTYLLN